VSKLAQNSPELALAWPMLSITVATEPRRKAAAASEQLHLARCLLRNEARWLMVARGATACDVICAPAVNAAADPSAATAAAAMRPSMRLGFALLAAQPTTRLLFFASCASVQAGFWWL
jgi:hypothetical protein